MDMDAGALDAWVADTGLVGGAEDVPDGAVLVDRLGESVDGGVDVTAAEAVSDTGEAEETAGREGVSVGDPDGAEEATEAGAEDKEGLAFAEEP